MIVNAYTIYDRKSGIFGNPFFSQNHDTAIRDFTAFCNLPQNNYIAPDLELYAVGTFDSDCGFLSNVNYSKPMFLINYVDMESAK